MTKLEEIKEKQKIIKELSDASKEYISAISSLENKITYDYLPNHIEDMEYAQELLSSYINRLEEYRKGNELIRKITINEDRDKESYFRNSKIKCNGYDLITTLYDEQVLFSFKENDKTIFSTYPSLMLARIKED